MFHRHLPSGEARLVMSEQWEATVQIEDIKTVLKLAKAEHDNSSEDMSREAHALQGKAVEAVEAWLINVGALPHSNTIRGGSFNEDR
jgi:hypothetical protein